jgi:hypothetical protein
LGLINNLVSDANGGELKTMNPTILRPRFSLFLLTVPLNFTVLSSNSYNQDTLPDEAVGQIIRDRGRARRYVEDVLLLDVSVSEYSMSKRLYGQTKEAYEGWVASVSSAIRRNTLKKLSKSRPFKNSCRDAGLAGKQFTNYVDSLILQRQGEQRAGGLPLFSDQKKTGPQLFSDLVDIVGKIAEKVQDFRKRQAEVGAAEAIAEQEWLKYREKLAQRFRS